MLCVLSNHAISCQLAAAASAHSIFYFLLEYFQHFLSNIICRMSTRARSSERQRKSTKENCERESRRETRLKCTRRYVRHHQWEHVADTYALPLSRLGFIAIVCQQFVYFEFVCSSVEFTVYSFPTHLLLRLFFHTKSERQDSLHAPHHPIFPFAALLPLSSWSRGACSSNI